MPGYLRRVDGISHTGPNWEYLQLAALLRTLVAGMNPHQPLPSVRTLCEEHGLSEKTVSKVLHLLEDEGLVYIVPSRGTYVSPQR
jgi:GntR family transcriptional regulator